MVETFIQWCESNKRDLSFLTEKTKRGGIHTAYPKGYIYSQYADDKSGSYFAPYSATAATVDLPNIRGVTTKAPSDEAP
jgi:hypothetical protein